MKTPGTNSGTGAWQKMWRLAVEAELQRMIDEFIRFLAGELVSICKSERSLRELLQSDFDNWTERNNQIKKLRKKNEDARTLVADGSISGTATGTASVTASAITATDSAKISKGKSPAKRATTTTTPAPDPSSSSAPAPTSLPPPPPRSRLPAKAPKDDSFIPWTSGHFPLIEQYKPDYELWPSFQQGYNLYGELSMNIHTYNESYVVHDVNFTKSQRAILKWLEPEVVDGEGKGDVNWEGEWARRGF